MGCVELGQCQKFWVPALPLVPGSDSDPWSPQPRSSFSRTHPAYFSGLFIQLTHRSYTALHHPAPMDELVSYGFDFPGLNMLQWG